MSRLVSVRPRPSRLRSVGARPVREPRAQSPDAEVREPDSVAYLFSDGNLPGTLKAFKALLQERPDLRDRAPHASSPSRCCRRERRRDLAANVLVLDTMNQQMLERFNAENKLDLIAAVRGRAGRCSRLAKGCCRRSTTSNRACALGRARARLLGAHGGQSNQVGLLKYALTQAGIRGLTLPAPQPSLDFGYYYPVAREVGGTGQAGVRDVGRVHRVAAEAWQAPAGRAAHCRRLLQGDLLRRRNRTARRGHRGDRAARRRSGSDLRLSRRGCRRTPAARRRRQRARGRRARLLLQLRRTGRRRNRWPRSMSRSSI